MFLDLIPKENKGLPAIEGFPILKKEQRPFPLEKISLAVARGETHF